MLEHKLLAHLQQRVSAAHLPVRLRFWNGVEIQGSEPPLATLTLRSPQALISLARPSLSRLAEAYVKQDFDFDVSMRQLTSLIAPFLVPDGTPQHTVRRSWRRLWRHTKARDMRAIQSHYDVSDEFYALWLDSRRVYSCAYFRGPDDSLEQAQEQKLEHICRKLCLRPRQAFLDIGCGWGGLLFHAVEQHQVNATGITLSRHQHDYVAGQIAQRGLGQRCRVALMDYRDLPRDAQFDAIASVGMFEHVGRKNLPLYFRTIRSLLKPGGFVMNHGITAATEDDAEVAGGGRDFIERYVFPGGELVQLATVLQCMEGAQLECRDVENLRTHYAMTLWRWVERLEAAHAQAVELVGERRYRIWHAYMGGFAHAFERGWNAIHQILAARPLDDGRVEYPLTREHLYR